MKPLVWSVLLVLPVGALAADVYRTVGENGEVIYSDLPSASAERVTVTVPGAGRSADRAASESESADAATEAAGNPLGAQIPRPSTPEEIAAALRDLMAAGPATEPKVAAATRE